MTSLHSSSAQSTHDFSVIVSTRGRPAQLARCLEALAALDYPSDLLEVIVVHDGEEATATAPAGLRLTVLSQDKRGPATARNRGAAVAAGEFFAFTDDDCAPASDWLTHLGRRIDAAPDAVVGGLTVNALGRNRYSTTSQLVVDALYSYHARYPRGAFFTTNNLALTADAFRAVGGFDPSFPYAGGEDREFADRCVRHGLRLTYAPEAVVHHFNDLTLRSFVRQHFTYGRGAAHFHRARLRRGQGRLAVESRFYGPLLSLPFRRHGVRGTALATLAALTQVSHIAGFLWEDRVWRRGR